MDKLKKTYLLQLTKTLIKPAFGCTEIGVISLVAAAAAKCIKHPIIKVEIEVSSYIYRNVIDVGVPRLGRCGIKGIVAAGLLIKDTSK
jgi:L-cysteine desulfidase